MFIRFIAQNIPLAGAQFGCDVKLCCPKNDLEYKLLQFQMLYEMFVEHDTHQSPPST